MAVEHVDVLIVGAGLSGVCAAYYAQTHCPDKRYAVLEARSAIGGTWDLFRYPGVRSDSDMHTLGYSFRPWRDPKAIADGPAILRYVRETSAEFGIDQKIRFNQRLRSASWSSSAQRWTVEIERGSSQEAQVMTCEFLFMCTGYYDYAQGFLPKWPGMEDFEGRIVHPQRWPEDLDYAGTRVVVIGSGATAVTLAPAMAHTAGHVTMLQRSPTYIVARPSEDPIANWLRRHLPARLAGRLTRWKNIAFGMYFYALARRRPEKVKQAIVRMAREELGVDYDVETHFTPRYNPWDQRLCLVPDADLFKAITSGKVSMVTDVIETFTKTGLRLRSGADLPADIIVTATGLTMRLMSGVQLIVDGAPVDLAKSLSYRGMMYSGVPNLASSFGYTNASWTLKCELIAQYVVRLLTYMDQHGYAECRPQRPAPPMDEEPVVNLKSGYVQRALATLPRQGKHAPWRTCQNYLRDVFYLGHARFNDGAMRFVTRRTRVAQSASRAAASSAAR
jgi:cation diffusion facilitator CzcD-associated flavoprotein CzcO